MKSLPLKFKRCIALVLAMALIVSGINLGNKWRVNAGNDMTSVTVGDLVAKNYAGKLSDAEEKLLASGYLVGDTITYTTPEEEDGLVLVDTETKQITAESYQSKPTGYTWYPTVAKIVVGDEVKEKIDLQEAGGKYICAYTYQENAFSVEVEYKLTFTAGEDLQKTLLGAAGALKAGVENLDKVLNADATLCLIAMALPELAVFASAEGYPLPNGASVGFPDEVKLYVNKLINQIKTNGDVNEDEYADLNLSVMIQDYANALNKTEYLVGKGEELKECLQETYDAIAKMKGTGPLSSSFMSALKFYDPAMYTQLNLYVNILNTSIDTWLTETEKILAADWSGATKADGLVKADADYAKLDALVDALDTVVNVNDITIVNPLSVDTASVRVNMSMKDVAVKVELQIVKDAVGSADLVKYGETHEEVITLAEGATKQEILDAVAQKGIVEAAKEKWNGVYVEDKYESLTTTLPDTLTEDIEYTITYAPKKFDVTYNYTTDAPVVVPYGYQLALPKHETAGKSYDYTVNSKAHYELDVITITENTTVERVEGRAYDAHQLHTLIANQLMKNANEGKMLLSGALKLVDEAILVRTPIDENDTLVQLNEAEKTVTANEYPASYNGLSWVPATLKVHVGSQITEIAFVGNKATFTAEDYDYVEVVYQLTLTNYEESELKDILNTAVLLSNEAAYQREQLSVLLNNLSTLQMLNSTTLSAAGGVIADSCGQNAANAIAVIRNNCIDKATSNLKLAIYVGNYESQGLDYYYKNYKEIQSQLDIMLEQLDVVLEDYATDNNGDGVPDFKAAMSTLGYGEFYDKVPEIAQVLKNINLTAPNALIDMTSGDSALDDLTNAFAEAGKLNSYASTALLVLESSITKEPSDKASIKVNVTVSGTTVNGSPVTVTKYKGEVISDGDVKELQAAIKKLVENLNPERYANDYDNYDWSALVGQAIENNIVIDFAWTTKSITPEISGEVIPEASVSLDCTDVNNVKISLKASTDPQYVLTYVIAGKEIEVLTDSILSLADIGFAEKEIDELFAAGMMAYSVKKIDQYYSQLLNLVNALNAQMGSAANFTLKQNGEGFAIVMNVKSVFGLTSSIAGFGNALVESKYGYIGLETAGGQTDFVTTDGALAISIQTLIDAIVDVDGVGMNTLIKALNADGTLNSKAVPKINGKVVVDGGAIGALLVQTKMYLGNNSDEIRYTPDFYVTMTDTDAKIVKARNAIAKAINYVNVETKNGKVNVTLDLPEKVYEAYLTVLILTGEVDLTDVSAVSNAIAFAYLEDLVKPLLEDDVTIDTYQNTIDMLGQDFDVTQYESIFKAIMSLDIETSADEVYNMTVSAEAKKLIDSLGAGSFGSMIKEYPDGMIKIDLTADLVDAGTKFEALVVDPYNEALKNKADYTTNLIDRITDISGASMIVLLDDIKGDLVFANTTILDLNGFTVDGSITANGQLVILDSKLDTANSGEVINGVTGNNVTILGGKYGNNVGGYLQSGYVQVNGVVQNKFYTISSENGNVVFNLNADLLAGVDRPSIKALALDLAWDLAVNYFTTAALSFGGNSIYAVEFEDLVGLLAGENTTDKAIQMVLDVIDCEGIMNFVNTFIADCLKFADIEAAIDNDEVILSYDMVTKAWDVTLTHEKDGDYFTVNVVPGNEKNGSIGIKLVGEKENKDQIADLAGAFSEIVVINGTEIKLETLKDLVYNNKTVYVSASGKAVVELDLSKNPEYAVIIGVVLGYGNDALEATMAEAVEKFFAIGSTDAIKKAFDSVSVKQIFNALKAVNRSTDFAEMAAEIGVDAALVGDAATLEKTYHKLLIVAGAILDELDIAGDNRTMSGLLDKNDYGRYVLDAFNKNLSGQKEIYAGYGVNYDLSAVEIVLNVKLFNEEEPIKEELIEVFDTNNNIVYSGTSLSKAFEAVVGDGYTVKINGEVVMSEDIEAANKVSVIGAQNIKYPEDVTPVFVLTAAEAEITADAALNAVVDVDALEGYVAKVTEADSKYVYYAAKIAAPVTGAPVAGSLVLENGNRYLVLDMEPKKGMTWDAFLANAVFEDLAAYELTVSKEGSELVKTADELAVVAMQNGKAVAKISYVVVVLGDTNCNGKVNSSDTPHMKDIYRGDYTVLETKYNATQIAAIELAADANWNGKVNSSDVTMIMNKYFHWEMYESKLEDTAVE